MINETYDFSMNNKLGKRLQMYASKLKELETKQKEKKKGIPGRQHALPLLRQPGYFPECRRYLP